MKLNKKSTILTFFILGALVLAMSAFADIKLGSGYTNLKDALKTTSSKLAGEVDNFTVDLVASLKLDGKVFEEVVSKVKFDVKNNSRETRDLNLSKGELREHYWYSDEKQSIYKNFEDGSYTVYEKRKPNVKDDKKVINDIFEDEQMKDLEKIVDAFVGNLQDIVQVEESDGNKLYSGNLSESQIPSTINAMSSFFFKYAIMNEWNMKNWDIPYAKSNVHLVDMMGKAVENRDGIIESIIFTASISAEDENGVEHIYSLELSMNIKDINNTVVKAPDLEGKEVTYTKEGYNFDEKYIGKYKSDIVIEKNNEFLKIGERFVEITSVEDDSFKGKYYEVYKEGYEADNIRSFDFIAKYSEVGYFMEMEYINENGKTEKGVIHQSGRHNIDVNLNVEINEKNGGYSYSSEEEFNTNFIRVFE